MDLSTIACFADLSESGRKELLGATVRRTVRSGEVLMVEGQVSSSMYFVMSGRFAVQVAGHLGTIAEISVGQTIGEIGFLSGTSRTATATAVRDSIVLELSAKDFDALCERFPEMLKEISISLARKLAAATNAYRDQPYVAPATLAICRAGSSDDLGPFANALCKALAQTGPVAVLDSSLATAALGSLDDDEKLSEWLHDQETRNSFLFYIADADLTRWTRVCLRQADQVLLVAMDEADPTPNAVELGLADFDALEQTLIICHDTRIRLSGSQRWCDPRPQALYHHVAFDDPATVERIARFITGTATGLVASGGGAFTAAHLGVFRAFAEAGIGFDVVGGASGGAAVGCSLAAGVESRDMSEGTEQMMVKSGAMKRFTLPVYSLVDHRYFDARMREQYGDLRIEDFWNTFFAVSTNLSTGELEVHQRGLLWKAIRASASIPGMLPPLITERGDLLVDGGILDNVPLATMKSIKTGPNIVLCFEPREQSRTSMRYDELPGRRELLGKLVRHKRTTDTDMPRIASVLTQCMLLNNTSMTEAGDSDLILRMSLPDDLKLNDWHRHREMTEIGYRQAKEWLKKNAGNALLECFKRSN